MIMREASNENVRNSFDARPSRVERAQSQIKALLSVVLIPYAAMIFTLTSRTRSKLVLASSAS